MLGNMVRDVAAMFGVQMTPTVMAALVFGLLLVAFPFLKTNHSTRLARKRVNEAARERGEARQRLAAEALSLVAQNPIGQIVVAEEAVPVQRFVTRSDLPCGTTIGPIASSRLAIPTVDVGNPMLSMHSARELCGARDVDPMSRVMARLLRR